MADFRATVTSKGQMTLPAELRALWGLRPGDRVEFYTDREGGVFMRPCNVSPTAFFESLPARWRADAFESDDEAVSAAVLERDQRAKTRSAAE